jgi:hypothetical protein
VNQIRKKLEDRLSSFLTEEISFHKLVGSLIFTSLFLYGMKIFNFLLSIDEEFHSTVTSPDASWIFQGRWGMYLLNAIFFPFAILPVIPISFAILFYSVGTLLIFRLFSPKQGIIDYLCAAISLAFPSLIFIFSFSTISYGIGFGVFTVALAYWFLEQKRYAFDAVAILLFAFSIAIYQSLLLLILSVFFFGILVKSVGLQTKTAPVSARSLFNETKRFGTILFLSLGTYVLIQKLFLLVNDRHIEYIDGFVHDDFLKHPFLIFQKSLQEMSRWIFVGKSGVYLTRLYSLAALMIFCILVVLTKIYKLAATTAIKVSLIFAFFFAIYSPFLLHLLNRGEMPIRTLISLPFTVAAITYLGFQYANRTGKVLIVLFSVFVLFRFSVVVNRYQNATNMALEADRIFATQVMARIDALPLKPGIRYPFEMVGFLSRNTSNVFLKNETIGTSFFEWDQGNPSRAMTFMSLLGYDRLEGASNEKRLELVPLTRSMPMWPAAGSVSIVDRTIILKLGEYSGYQRMLICLANKKDPKCLEDSFAQ